jgi:hypothetical protein
MKFKVLGGQHVDENMRTYRKDDVIVSDFDLVDKFPNKFERLHDDPAPVPVANLEPIIPGKSKEADPPAEPPLVDYGDEVTEDYNCEDDIHVFRKGTWCTVMDADGKVLNDKKIRAKEVQAFIDDLYEDEVDEDGDSEEDDGNGTFSPDKEGGK